MLRLRSFALAVASFAALAVAPATSAAAPKTPSQEAVRKLERQVNLLSRAVVLQGRQIRNLERISWETPSEISAGSGSARIVTSSAGIELISSGGVLLLNSEGLSTHGPTLSSAMPIHFNRFACTGSPVLLYGGGGGKSNLYSGSLFSC